MSLMDTVRRYEHSVQCDFVQKIVQRIVEDLQYKDEVRYSDYLRGNAGMHRKPVENAFKRLIRSKTVKNIRRGIYGRGINYNK
jgi:hypothetical protein